MQLSITTIQATDEIEVSVVFRIPAAGGKLTSFEQAEEALALRLNEIGCGATGHLLSACDSNGEALQCDGKTWTSKGRAKRVVETPYGPYPTLCHVYQTSAGGSTRVPLEQRARLISSATPRMARMVASKLAAMNGAAVARDMESNHLRPLSHSYAQDLGCAVAALVTLRTDLTTWQPMSLPADVATVAVGVDGAHMHTRRDGWRQSMAGTIALYDTSGERLETLYVGGGPGETPPEGKTTFFARMDEMITLVRARYKQAKVVGLSDGAADLQKYLRTRTDAHLLDFHHAAEHLCAVAFAFAPEGKAEAPAAIAWAAEQRKIMRDEPGGALRVLGELRRRLQPMTKSSQSSGSCEPSSKRAALSKSARATLKGAETYFANHIGCMDYAGWQGQKLPIGSGVTEAACKTLIKQRMCQSGMRWSIAASDALISLRALYLTASRWDHFWTQHNHPTLTAL